MTVELKNDLAIRGTLHSVDQYLNVKLEDVEVVEKEKYPHMVRRVAASVVWLQRRASKCARTSRATRAREMPPLDSPPPIAPRVPRVPRAQLAVKNCFVRGSVVRYITLSKGDVNTELLQDATRRELAQAK